ncbi:MAG: hypothetical protein PHY50_03495, partial [Sideroxydans sp.]|nr:hypothetical protein [Sideroxydans sp.]
MMGGVLLAALSLNAFAEDQALAPAHNALNVLQSGEVSFSKDVMPILQDYCVSCHHPSPTSKG